jgi:hypothetical protein
MATMAEQGYYHDFLSPLDSPSLQLAADLAAAGSAAALALRARHLNGEFDATKEEGDTWAGSREGQDVFSSLTAGMNRAERRRQRHAEAKQAYEARKPAQRLGDGPVETEYHQTMTAVMAAVDEAFNGDAKGPDKKTGIVMLVFPYGDKSGRCNFMSNGADRGDIVTLFKEMIARFDGQPEQSGRA